MKILKVLPLLLILGCNGMSSEIRSPYFADNKILEKPRCQFKVSSNCWQRSIDLMMACVPGIDPEAPTYFSSERYRCSNQTTGGNSEIVFRNPVSLENTVSQNGLSFRVYNNLKPCFSFTGQSNGFKIDANLFGTLEVEHLVNGDTQVSCFDGESFVISKDEKEQGCVAGDLSISNVVPRVQMTQSEDEGRLGLTFSFLGIGASAAPIFDCRDL